VVQAGVVNDLHRGPGSSGFGITGAIDQTGYACVNERPSTHGTRLNSGDHCAANQTMVAGQCGCLAQGYDLSMGRGIVIQQIAIMALAEDLAILDY